MSADDKVQFYLSNWEDGPNVKAVGLVIFDKEIIKGFVFLINKYPGVQPFLS